MSTDFELEPVTTSGSDEQLDRIEAKLDILLGHVEKVQEGITSAQKNPMIRQMLKSYGF